MMTKQTAGMMVTMSILVCAGARADDPAMAKDLLPVKLHPAPAHAPVRLVEQGVGRAVIVTHGGVAGQARQMVNELQTAIRLTSGAELPFAGPDQSNTHEGAKIHVGDWDGAVTVGLKGGDLPVEGFAIKTAADAVYIVGNGDGLAWGLCEFLERFVGVRWFWPLQVQGRSVLALDTITVAPTHLTDAPHFAKRVYFPPFAPDAGYTNLQFGPLLTALRQGTSYPVNLAVHTPRSWHTNEEYVKNRPEIFQLNRDGTRNFQMLDYAHPRTLETYLEEIADHVANGTKKEFIIGKSVTVSPADFAVNSYSPQAQALWDADAGRYGQASRVMADFVRRLGEVLKTRFPELHVIYLPYMNYTLAPDGIVFPGNVHVQLCGMPGIAQYKEPSIREYEQKTIDRWRAASGHPITDWHYSCWPADRTMAPFQYPNVLQRFYRDNRDKTKGTFINGDNYNEWGRFHITLYAWMKLLWSPDYNVAAGVEAFSRRMFGPAGETVHELLNLQIKSWEESRWTNAVMTAQAVYQHSYPRETKDRIKALLEKAGKEVAGDAVLQERFTYFARPFADFFREFAQVVDGEGMREMTAMKVMESPAINGKLDDAVWASAQPVALRKRLNDGTQGETQHPTTVRAVWTLDGVTFGFHMAEPAPTALKRDVKARDHALTWHDDCVELFIDVTGENQGRCAQLVINANHAVQDLFAGDETWGAEHVKVGSHIGDDFWSLEVFIPFGDLAYKKGSSGGDRWGIQVTRHRTGKKVDGASVGVWENQKLNAASGGFNSNLSDFSFLNFRE